MENRPQKQEQQKSITNDSGFTPNPNFKKMQQIIHSSDSSASGWEKCWQLGLTPWDLGQPTPVMVHLHQAGALPKGRALVPGCGSGHDVVAIACPERYVVGLDMSDEAIKKAIELSSSLPNADYFTFLKEDFFTWRPTELFDLIFDYTFFCAIEPDMRSAWACQMRDLLKPDGELITLMFPISDHVGGPPYKVSVADYEEFLNPIGFKAVSIVDNELAIAPRKVFLTASTAAAAGAPPLSSPSSDLADLADLPTQEHHSDMPDSDAFSFHQRRRLSLRGGDTISAVNVTALPFPSLLAPSF